MRGRSQLFTGEKSGLLCRDPPKKEGSRGEFSPPWQCQGQTAWEELSPPRPQARCSQRAGGNTHPHPQPGREPGVQLKMIASFGTELPGWACLGCNDLLTGVRARLAPFLSVSISFGKCKPETGWGYQGGTRSSGTSSNPEPEASVKPVEASANPPLSLL